MLGKFMPPHAGHRYLVDFARHYCEEVVVVVGTLASEPIPGKIRFEWMKELFPTVSVVHLTDENPQFPEEHPDFWEIWKASLDRVAGPIDYLFASETYGEQLAGVLGARFIPTNGLRELIPVSGTEIRENPYRHWEYLPTLVRPYFLKRVCLYGPESTGKSTLALRLANHFRTVVVPEYARIHLERKEGEFELEDVPLIGQGQWASEQALARVANRILFCDTDVLTTAIWSDWMFGRVPGELETLISEQTYDLYLLTDVDVPWIEDPIRYLPDQRQQFFQRCREELIRHSHHFVTVSGGWEERFRVARQAVETLIN